MCDMAAPIIAFARKIGTVVRTTPLALSTATMITSPPNHPILNDPSLRSTWAHRAWVHVGAHVEKTGGGGYIDRMRGVTEVLKWLAINFRDSVTYLFSRWLAFRQAHLVMCIVSSKPTSTWISFWAPRRLLSS